MNTMTALDYKILGLLKAAKADKDDALAAMCDIALRANDNNPAVKAAVAYCKNVLGL